MDDIDHRWGNRVPVMLEVEVDAGASSPEPGRMRDVSISGAWLEMRHPPPLLTLVRVAVPRFHATDEGGETAMACVVRRSDGGAGIEWCELAPPLVGRILSMALARKPPAVGWQALYGQAG